MYTFPPPFLKFNNNKNTPLIVVVESGPIIYVVILRIFLQIRGSKNVI